MSSYNNIIFDLGGVLIDWDPDYLYKKLIPDQEKRKWFLQNVCTMEWNVQQDAGRTWAEATTSLQEEYPDWKNEIEAYFGRWVEMLNGPINGTLDILKYFHDSPDHNIYALTNWSAETFPYAIERYDFLNWFEGIVVSGKEKTRKPFADIYNILLNRYELNPSSCLFIDDNRDNINAAKELGISGILFSSPEQLQEDLTALKLM